MVCPRRQHLDDDKLWSIHNYNSDFKKWFKTHFNLQQGDWDEGWGWKKYEPTYAFPKMYNAAYLLTFGLSTETRYWKGEAIKVHSLKGTNAGNPSRPVVTIKNNLTSEILHIFVRSSEKQLIHYWRDTADWNDLWYVENVTMTRTNPGFTPLFTGELVILNGPSGCMRLIGLSHSYGTIVDFKQDSVGNSGNWTATSINPQAGDLDPLQVGVGPSGVVKDSLGHIHVFGKNYENQLIHFIWDDAWSIENVSGIIHPNSNLRLSGEPVATVEHVSDITHPNRTRERVESVRSRAHVSRDKLHVFALGLETTGNLIGPMNLFYYYWTANEGWGFEDLTSDASSDYGFTRKSGLPPYEEPDILVLNYPDPQRLDVFGSNNQAELLHYYRPPNENWYADVVTKLNTIGSAYKIPFGKAAIYGPGHVHHVFGRNHERDVIHYFRPLDGDWKAENITSIIGRTQSRIKGNPAVYMGVYGTQHLFAQGSFRDLLTEYYKKNNTDWWFDWPVMHMNLTATEEPEYHINGIPTFVEMIPLENLFLDAMGYSHFPTDKHMFALSLDSDYIVHFSSKGPHAWHSNADYYCWASGQSGGFKYEPEDEDGLTEAQAFWGIGQTDRVEMLCPIFDDDRGPGYRAAAMLHEATHIILETRHDYSDDFGKDEWYHHYLGEIPFDTLDPEKAEHKHSMFQIQVEWLADLAEFSKMWVPRTILDNSKDEANQFIATRFTNDVGWIVGEPRPFLI